MQEKWWVYFLVFLIFGCQSTSDKKENSRIIQDAQSIKADQITICLNKVTSERRCHPDLTKTSIPDTATYDLRIELFDNSDYTIQHLSNLYKKNEIVVLNVGQWHSSVPFENQYVSDYLLNQQFENDVYETFDSLTCEVGGNSAYDKYIFKRDKRGRIIQVDHYMAWFDRFAIGGENYLDYSPDWFLGNIIKLLYRPNVRIIENYWEGDSLTEKITDFYDNKGRMVMQNLEVGKKKYSAHYYYE
jgi:hypothetical protein